MRGWRRKSHLLPVVDNRSGRGIGQASVLRDDTLVITFKETLMPIETALARPRRAMASANEGMVTLNYS
jgi:hypothetical protein